MYISCNVQLNGKWNERMIHKSVCRPYFVLLLTVFVFICKITKVHSSSQIFSSSCLVVTNSWNKLKNQIMIFSANRRQFCILIKHLKLFSTIIYKVMIKEKRKIFIRRNFMRRENNIKWSSRVCQVIFMSIRISLRSLNHYKKIKW